MKFSLCFLLGHRWLITEHVDPIVGKFKLKDEAHPLSEHRFGWLGYVSKYEYEPEKFISTPLAGCRAKCDRCGAEANDMHPSESTRKLEQPILLVSRSEL
jgi:hypothetical protein